MELRHTIDISEHDRQDAVLTDCHLTIDPMIFGYRLSFDFRGSTFERPKQDTLTTIGCEMDLYFGGAADSVRLGRMYAALTDRPILLNGRDTSIRRQLD